MIKRPQHLTLLLLTAVSAFCLSSPYPAQAAPAQPELHQWQQLHHHEGEGSNIELHPLSFCPSPLSSLTHGDATKLRDLIQIHQQRLRSATDARTFLHVHQNPRESEKDPGWRNAFASPLSGAELQQRVAAAEAEEDNAQRQLQGTIHKLQREGLLPAGFTESELSNCLMGRLNPRLYPEVPQVSFLLQYFNRPWMIQPIVQGLRACQKIKSELVVNVDSNEEGALEWIRQAHLTSGYVVPVFSTNLHEIRAYNRLAGLARGRVLVVLQDDQVPPAGCVWLRNVLAIFGGHPKVGAVGLKGFRLNRRSDNNVDKGSVFFEDPTLGVHMHFAMLVDFAPVAVLRSAFNHVGGLDEGLSDVGMCGIYSDFELSMRFWSAGWQVAFYILPPDAKPQRDTSNVPGGTHQGENEHQCWRRQMSLSDKVYQQRWVGQHNLMQRELAKTVRHLNLNLLQRVEGTVCPFSEAIGGCNPGSNGTAEA